jgi:DNA-directed RNA polymerase beta' subunit
LKINVLDIDRAINVNKLEEVTSAKIFSNKMMYDPDGIMSSDIFGISKDDRRSTFAYVNLKIHFIHPHIYHNVLKRMFKPILYIVSGQKRYTIKDGKIVEDTEGWTGIISLYNHWDEIDWRKSSTTNQTNREILMNLKRDEIFLDKILVVPPAYRDIAIGSMENSSDRVNELNNLYTSLLRYVSMIQDGGMFARTQYAIQMKIQENLVSIYGYFKKQISSKKGMIRKYLLGKSVDYGVRAVISAPSYNFEHLEDNIVDMEHTAVPISMCCSLFYPFIEHWLRNFFTREVVNDRNSIIFYDVTTGREFNATIKDIDTQFSEKKIKKMINDYCLNPDNRFQQVAVEVEAKSSKGTKTSTAIMLLKGKQILANNTTKELKRPLTITDLLYLASVETCANRHVMVSRYPVGTDKGIYFNKINVQSTPKHIRVIFNGKEYPYYPDIDLSLDQSKVGVQFIDTLVLSNSHLDGMGADYDGDVLSIRGLWSDEANDEAEEIMNKKTSALNITGSNAKVVAKELFNSFYELTKDYKGGRTISGNEANELLKVTPTGITRSWLCDLLADTVDTEKAHKAGKHKSLYNTWDILRIPKNYFYDGQQEMSMTLGRFIVNKFVLEGAGVLPIIPLVNKELTSSGVKAMDALIADKYLNDEIDREQFNSYTDRRDTLGYWTNGLLAHSISERMSKPLPEIEKRKAELVKKYEKEIAAGDIDVMTQIQNELVSYAEELLKDDPGIDLYKSGDLSMSNNYKNNSIIKGAVMNKITGEFDFIDSSFMDGIKIKDIPAHANSILASQYPASIATADAGYMGKKLLALLQMMEVDEPGTDCGTKNYIPITINDNNASAIKYTYIKDGSGEKLLGDDIKSYIGKTVLMRSPMSCLNTKICSKCAGKLFELLGIKNAGLFSTKLSHTDLNIALKAKHNSQIDLYTMDPNELIEDL